MSRYQHGRSWHLLFWNSSLVKKIFFTIYRTKHWNSSPDQNYTWIKTTRSLILTCAAQWHCARRIGTEWYWIFMCVNHLTWSMNSELHVGQVTAHGQWAWEQGGKTRPSPASCMMISEPSEGTEVDLFIYLYLS